LIGNDTDDKRKRIKRGVLSNTISIVSLCGMFNEGISIDNLQTVIFGDLRHSRINKIQIAMRASRLHPTKPFYRIIIPINNDDLKGNDIKKIINSFEEIDENIRTAIKTKSQTRIKN